MKINQSHFFTIIFLSISGISFSQAPDPTKNRHEFVTRVERPNELSLGNYVVIQEFEAEKHAKFFADEAKKLGYPDVSYGYLTNKKSWLVYFGSSDDIETTRTIRDKYRKVNMFKDAWMLTVHEGA